MEPRTVKNVLDAFVGEARAHQRLLAYADRADREGLAQIAALFRAVAASEAVHARRHFALLERVADTQTNLERAFESEQLVNGVTYARMLLQAIEDGDGRAAKVFSQARDVEELHASMYKVALENLLADRTVEYHVCVVCGYLTEGEPHDRCPVCLARAAKFEPVEHVRTPAIQGVDTTSLFPVYASPAPAPAEPDRPQSRWVGG